jgi:hypothetical protein
MQAHPQNRHEKNADKKPLYIIAVKKIRSFILISFVSIVAASVIATGEAAQTNRRVGRPTATTTATEGRAR